MALKDYESFISEYVNPLVKLTHLLGPDGIEIGAVFENCFKAQFDFLKKASQSSKPIDKQLQEWLQPTVDCLQQLNSMKPGLLNLHLQTLQEGLQALCWVSVYPLPVPHITECKASMEFYANKIMKQYKGKDDNHCLWAKAFIELLSSLANYVKKHHTTGLTWNSEKGSSDASAENTPVPEAGMQMFQEWRTNYLKPWLSLCADVGGDVKEMATLVDSVFESQKEFFSKAISMKKPNDIEYQIMLQPFLDNVQKVTTVYESKKRSSPFPHHLASISEGVNCTVWPTLSTLPVPYINEVIGAMDFYNNKIMSTYKTTEPRHIEWAKAWKLSLVEYSKFVKATHTTGVAWNQCVGATVKSSVASDIPTHGSVAEFDKFFEEHIVPLQQLSKELGGDIDSLGKLIFDAFDQQRAFLKMVSVSKRPNDSQLSVFLKPTVDILTKASSFDNKNLRGKYANHASAVNEGLQILGWVTVATPISFIDDALGSMDMYNNKVMTTFKTEDQRHVEWAKSLKQTILALKQYVKAHHTAGLNWNPNGKDAFLPDIASTQIKLPPKPSTPSLPPPPPPPSSMPLPPPPPPIMVCTEAAKPALTGHAALFAQLSQGTAITSGLRHVTKDMKTKNRPKDESDSPVPIASKKVEPKKAALIKKEPALLELQDGNKWMIQCQEGTRMERKSITLTAEQVAKHHAIYVYKCNHVNIFIQGKVNSIGLVECQQTSACFQTCIANLEICNSRRIEAQVLDTLPSCAIDKSHDVMLTLSEQSLGCEILTCAATGINVTIPGQNPGDEPEEFPIPEQFISQVVNYNLKTIPAKHAG